MTGPNIRHGEASGWPLGLYEQEIGDSSRLPRESIAAGSNIRIDETGSITGRRGITARAVGLPANDYSVEEFKSALIHAAIACDGKTIRVLESTGWVAKGTFANDSGRASIALMNQRAYIANGIDRLLVVEFIGGTWKVRNAGVDPSLFSVVVTATGGSGADIPFNHAFSFVDDRGFESNISPIVTATSKIGGVGGIFTMSSIPVAPANANIVTKRIYSSFANQREVFLVKSIPNATTSTSYDTLTVTRDESISGPTPNGTQDNTIPPNGIFSLIAYKNRMFGARQTGLPSYYEFSRLGQPEYWPAGFSQDLTVSKDSSDTVNFGLSSIGLFPMKGTSVLLLDGDPEITTAPFPVLQGAGLVHPDGIISKDGASFFIVQRGVIAHDGFRVEELWRQVKKTSDYAIAAAKVVGTAHDTRISFFFRNPEDTTKNTSLTYDTDKQRFLKDNITTSTGTITIDDTSRDFSEDADVSLHENVENGAQTIAAGGGTFTITLSGANSAKLVNGVAIKFIGFATIFIVELLAGANITVDSITPPDTTAVEYIRGTVVRDGLLTLIGVA